MGNTSSGSYNGSQTNVNIQNMYNSTQYNNSILCESSCTDLINDSYIIIENSTVGNINFDQECQSDASCVLEYDIEYINSMQQQNINFSSVESEKFAIPNTTGVSTDDADIYVRVFNYNLQSSYTSTSININTTCKSVVNNVQEDIFITIKNSTTGDINFTQKGNASLSCASVNDAKSSESVNLINNQELQGIVKNDVQNAGLIAILFFSIVVLIFGLYIIFGFKKEEPLSVEKPKTINISKVSSSEKKDIVENDK